MRGGFSNNRDILLIFSLILVVGLFIGVFPPLIQAQTTNDNSQLRETQSVPLKLDPRQKRIDPALAISMLEDPEGSLRYEDVIGKARDQFRPARQDRLNLGYSKSAYWLRIELDLSDSSSTQWLLEIGYALLDDVEFYVRGNRDEPHVVRTGDHRPFSRRDVVTPTFVFHVPDDLGERVELYLRVRSEGTINIPLTFWREDAFTAETNWRELSWGLYFGILLALGLYNLYLWIAVRERMYICYVGYLTGVGCFQASLSGHAFQYLWPNFSGFATISPGVFLVLFVSAGVHFIREVAAVSTTAPRMNRPLIVLSCVPVVLMPLIWIDYSIGIQILTAMAVLILCVLPFPVIRAYRLGYHPARYVALAFFALFPAWILLGLRHSGLDIGDLIIIHTVQIATAVDALLLSFAQADRISLLRRDEQKAQVRRLEAEQEALEAQRDLSQGLIEAQDAERKRIASELHDGLGQSMLVLCNELSRLARRSDDESKAKSLAQMAKQAVGDVRVMSHELHPHKLDRLGLASAIESTATQALQSAAMDGEITIDEEVTQTLPPTIQLHLYRIAQEAMTNAIKHGEATKVDVSLEGKDDRIILRVRDNGKNAPEDFQAGLGLTSIHERARTLDGEVRLESKPGEGVCVEVDIPIPETEDSR